MKTIKNLASLAVMVLLITGVSVPAHADLITVDQILYKLNPVGGLTPEQAANLSATVNMTYATVPSSTNILLTVTLTNTSGNTTGTTPNASNLLTGIGFNLPTGVSVVDNATYNSTVAIASGSTLFNDPDGLLSQNDWGWRGNNTGGHFSLAGVLPVDLILSTSSADVLQTFGGGARNLVDGTDYGLISKTGSPANDAYIVDSVVFSIYLSGVTDPSSLLAFIQSEGVVAAYGSPADAQGQIVLGKVPEPMTLILYGLGFAGAGLYTRIRRRK